ncbi:hypothetical protein D3C73_1323110 [compost metagenome]
MADDAVFDITVRAYGAAPQDFLLYEDDGTSFDYRAGRYNWVRLSWKGQSGGSAGREGISAPQRYRIEGWEQHL